ncbi:response regulator FixJ [Hwanghaeella sp.]|uniref:response regulator FixJ n=1 Tax=Hwanghaeella sp. TaxID=2605943 RepID=UPI003CCC2599
MNDTPTVFVLDDDEAVRDALSVLFESCDLPVRTYASGELFLKDLNSNFSGCVVLDVRMPGLSGLDLQQRLLAMEIPLPVIIVTGHGDLPMAVKAMKAGAVDFIEKPFDDEVLLESVRDALTRGAKLRAESVLAESSKLGLDRLTAREREVLEKVALGHPNKVIAYDLGISPRTVEIHRARVIEKLQAKNLSHLVRIAIAAGIIHTNDTKT